MATEVSSAPGIASLQSVQKVMALPTVEAAVGQVGALYTRVKGKFHFSFYPHLIYPLIVQIIFFF